MAFLSNTAVHFRTVQHSCKICPQSLGVPQSLFVRRPSDTLVPVLNSGRRHHAGKTTMGLSEGQKAPSFTATDTDGNTISLDDFRGSNLVLYFSNLAGPGCTSQSCSFRDAEAAFSSLNAKIVAVAAQNRETAADFKSKNGLEFPIIPDKDGRIQKLFDVSATLGLLPGRITYVIDKDGVIRSAYNSQFAVSSHVDIAKNTLSQL